MRRMTRRTFLPAINDYASEIAESLKRYREMAPESKTTAQKTILANLLDGIEKIYALVEELDTAGKKAQEIENLQERANYYAHSVIPIMDQLREVVDYTETITDRSHWPVPSYNNMLFYV